MLIKDKFNSATEAFKWGMHVTHIDSMPTPKGRFIVDMRDETTGEQLLYWEKDNIITLDAGIQTARLYHGSIGKAGINMLAVGSGATGSPINPDAPDNRQRKLNTEIARKAFASVVFRDADGAASNVPTNVVDFTTTFTGSEAVGSWTEMGVVSTVSSNPLTLNPNSDTFPTRTLTLDLTTFDVLVNYLTFGLITKPSNAVLTVTWRLTF